VKKALIIPDCHIPAEDKRAYEVMLQIASDLQPDQIVILGDYADFYCVSSHPKDLGSNIPLMLEKEVEAVKDRLDELDKYFPDAEKVFIEGNHEYRLARYLRDRAPELFGYVNTPELFNLYQRPKWKWCGYGPEQKFKVLNSRLWARHEPIGTSAKTTAQRAMCSVVFGHTHRIEEQQVVAIDGSEFVSFSPGFLGNKQHKIMQYVKNHAQWSKGFATAYIDTKTKYFYHQIHRILDNNTCLFQGRVFRP
jgi:UDP-2,3-diacylglucosamine pyrophosphatase LpxH